MKQNIIYIGLDVDDTQYHGSAFNKITGEVINIKCKPTLNGLLRQLVKLDQYFSGSAFKLCYEASYIGYALQRDLAKKMQTQAINKRLGYVNSVCPVCLDRSFDQNWDGKSLCGYQFPLSYIVDYGVSWDFSDEFIDELKQYKGARLAGAFKGKQPERLKELAHLTQLFISRYHGFSFGYLDNFEELDILDLDMVALETLDGVSRLRNIRSLALTECKQLTSLESVETLNLRILSITLCNKISDLERIREMDTLRSFRFEGKFIRDLVFLSGMESLEHININAKIESRDLAPIYNIKQLKKIGVKKTGFKKTDFVSLQEALPNCDIVVY